MSDMGGNLSAEGYTHIRLQDLDPSASKVVFRTPSGMQIVLEDGVGIEISYCGDRMTINDAGITIEIDSLVLAAPVVGLECETLDLKGDCTLRAMQNVAIAAETAKFHCKDFAVRSEKSVIVADKKEFTY